jgi:hypothetical protein
MKVQGGDGDNNKNPVTSPIEKPRLKKTRFKSEGNGGDGDGDDEDDGDSTVLSDSSDDDEASDDEEEDELYLSSRGTKHMDAKANPLPAIPANPQKVDEYRMRLDGELHNINATSLIRDEDRVSRPVWKESMGKKISKNKKYKKYLKRIKTWDEMNRTILHYIRGTALASGHTLKADLSRIYCGIEAYDFVMTSLDPVKYDIMTSSSEAMSNFESLELHSTQTGSFTKFVTLWNTSMEQLKANKLAMATDDAYLKVAFLNKLPYDNYKHVLMNESEFEDKTIAETIAKVGRFLKEMKQRVIAKGNR